ncbi:uncharacterized protein LOC109856676 isoform X3 [Pseudomyrmex gracilis]|uniref:uncharacterized protein LOC109856676 isoform X3 n=1 Tax=Pseudomyrmex gracilis TaxID=219809 RepID=UPI000994C6DD|nr:uncharacterized protein LOC109856676 isoform X3 [Pseudomyrmex gracilis]
MDDTRLLHKYYRASGYGLNSLMYKFLIADYHLKHLFNLNAYCGAVTFATFIFAVVMAVCSIMKLPRMESVVSIVPPYKCIHKHLQRMTVFQTKTKKTLCKEQLELEIMNSKMSCIEKLLKPEEQSEWRRSRSPKLYHRPINAETFK